MNKIMKRSHTNINIKLNQNENSSEQMENTFRQKTLALISKNAEKTNTQRSIYYMMSDSPAPTVKPRFSIVENVKTQNIRLPSISSPKTIVQTGRNSVVKSNIFCPDTGSQYQRSKPLPYNKPRASVDFQQLKRPRTKSNQNLKDEQKKNTKQNTQIYGSFVKEISVHLNFQKMGVGIYSQVGRRQNLLNKKHNQDQLIVYPSFSKDFKLFGVFDGHGSQGHQVAQKVAKILPGIVSNESIDLITQKIVGSSLTLSCDTTFQTTIFKDAYNETEALLEQSNINLQLSGCTSNIVLFAQQPKLEQYSPPPIFNNHIIERNYESVIYCAHIGDSRAIVVGNENPKQFDPKIFELSLDHRADDPAEQDRINSKGGIVDHYKDSKGAISGPARVWLPDRSSPGLAMSRSFGDRVAHSVGVISEPSIRKYAMKTYDKFLVMGSDGIWQYLSNLEVATIVGESQTPEEASSNLVKAATESWIKNDTVIDDISCIIIFFSQN